MSFARPTKERDLQEKTQNEEEHKEITQQKCGKSKIKIQIDFRIKHFRESSFIVVKPEGTWQVHRIYFKQKHFGKRILYFIKMPFAKIQFNRRIFRNCNLNETIYTTVV